MDRDRYPQYISGYEKVKITTTRQTSMMETEENLLEENPALYELWKKELLPHNILIVGASRREHTKESWLQTLGIILKSFVIG